MVVHTTRLQFQMSLLLLMMEETGLLNLRKLLILTEPNMEVQQASIPPTLKVKCQSIMASVVPVLARTTVVLLL